MLTIIWVFSESTYLLVEDLDWMLMKTQYMQNIKKLEVQLKEVCLYLHNSMMMAELALTCHYEVVVVVFM